MTGHGARDEGQGAAVQQLLSFHHFFLVQPATDAALGR
jgi:hypothetical protein